VVPTAPPSLFPSPQGPKIFHFDLACSSAGGLRRFFFELSNDVLAYMPWEAALEAIWDRFWLQKWSKNRSKINPKERSEFDFGF
jgi:hypothetical protein